MHKRLSCNVYLVRSEADDRERRRGPVREENSTSSTRREVIREHTGLAPGDNNLVIPYPGNEYLFVFQDWLDRRWKRMKRTEE